MELLGSTFVAPGKDVEEPLAIVFGALLFALVANAAYTMEWALELRIPASDPGAHQAFRARSFRKVLRWSCAVASLPVWL
jgi:hypothetical protein